MMIYGNGTRVIAWHVIPEQWLSSIFPDDTSFKAVRLCLFLCMERAAT